MIRIGSFISPSEHKDFIIQLDKALIDLPDESRDEELIAEKEKLIELYVRYKIIFTELPELINEYKLQKIKVRKRLRKVQMNK